MKKSLILIISLILSIGWAHAFEKDGIHYTIIDGEAVVINPALDDEQVEKVVVRLDIGMFGQGTLCNHVTMAEIFFGYRNADMFVTHPQHLAPMHGVCVNRASVVEYDALNHESVTIYCSVVYKNFHACGAYRDIAK